MYFFDILFLSLKRETDGYRAEKSRHLDRNGPAMKL